LVWITWSMIKRKAVAITSHAGSSDHAAGDRHKRT
jgi:hypothetical protein